MSASKMSLIRIAVFSHTVVLDSRDGLPHYGVRRSNQWTAMTPEQASQEAAADLNRVRFEWIMTKNLIYAGYDEIECRRRLDDMMRTIETFNRTLRRT